ncbi:MAG: GAF domain-containing protein, partial [Deltaproteobacteria bacterium]|nr:GAF domain-containing protein [Deltaproteobacteria bacterium]
MSDFAGSASLHEMGSETQRLLALLLLKHDRAFTEVSILDDRGMEVVKVSERHVYLAADFADQSGSEKFRKAVKGESYISPVYTSDRAEPYVTVAVPLRITPRTVVGVVTAEANLKSLWEVIGEIEFGHAGYAYLVDDRGNLIAHRDPSLVLKRTSLAQIHKVQEFLRNPEGADSTPAEEGQGIIDKPVLSTFVPVRGLGWAVILEEPVDVALAEVRRLERYAMLLLVVVLLIGAIAIVWASDKITKPIRELHRGAEIIAGGNLDHRVVVQTGDEIQQLADGFNKMASALKGSYVTLEEKVEQRTKELSALYDVTATVNRTLELEPVLREVIKKITEIFHFDATRIFLLDPQMDELQLQASFETRPEFWAQIRSFRKGRGIVGRVGESGEAAVFEDVRTDPRYQAWSQSKANQKAGFAFLAGFPIRTKDRTVGTLLLIGQSPRKLTVDEVQLLTSMAEQVGVAVENARLFAEVVKKSQELQALVEINKGIAALLDREVLLPRIADEARNLLKMDGANFRLIEGEYLVLAGESGSENLSLRPRLRLDESLSGKIVQENRAVAVRDFLEDPTIIEEHRETMRKAGYHSFLGVPLRVAGRIIGTINLYSKEEREFRPEEINSITAFADQAAIA